MVMGIEINALFIVAFALAILLVLGHQL